MGEPTAVAGIALDGFLPAAPPSQREHSPAWSSVVAQPEQSSRRHECMPGWAVAALSGTYWSRRCYQGAEWQNLEELGCGAELGRQSRPGQWHELGTPLTCPRRLLSPLLVAVRMNMLKRWETCGKQ